jgi:hypothetical protein
VEAITHLLGESDAGVQSGAVRGSDIIDAKRSKLLDDLFEPFRPIKPQMGTAEDPVEGILPGQVLGMGKDVDQTSMGTTQEHDRAAGGIDNQRQIIHKIILFKSIIRFYQKVLIRSLKRGDAGDNPRRRYTGGNLHGYFGKPEITAPSLYG